MACYSPLKAWYGQNVSQETGKREIVFNRRQAFEDLPLELPCGKCIGCRLERSRQWAMRCVHEASLHDENMFITLTYDDEFLPKNASLHKPDFTNFMKRLRKSLEPKKIRFFHAGEYGENDWANNSKHRDQYGISQLGRPHHHAIIFGHRFDDLELIAENDGTKLFTSQRLRATWGRGSVSLGDVSFESAAYVARYCVKKLNGDAAKEHYKRRLISGLVDIEPEYSTMSRRPGIGADWFKKFSGDCWPKDFVTLRGKVMKPPKFYEKMLLENDKEMYENIKLERQKTAKRRSDDNTPERLIAREKVKKAQITTLKRNLED